MIFFKKKKYPSFYNEYVSSFKGSKKDLNAIRFVVFDTETSGLDIKKDVVLSIGCVAVKNFSIHVADQFECFIVQEKFNKESVHIHGLLKNGKEKKVDEFTALKYFLKYIEDAVLVAHHAAFDVAMINTILKKYNLPNLKNKVIDTSYLFKKTKYVKDNNPYSLDYLCDYFSIKKHDRHTASGDAFLTALVFLKVTKLLTKKYKKLTLRHLTAWL